VKKKRGEREGVGGRGREGEERKEGRKKRRNVKIFRRYFSFFKI
jgi:hypothetical protein